MEKQSVNKKYEEYKKVWTDNHYPPRFSARMARMDLINYLETLGFNNEAAENIVKGALDHED